MVDCSEMTRSLEISSTQPKYPIPTGQVLDGRFLIEKHFNTEVFRNFYLGTYHDYDRTKWIFIKMKHDKFLKELKAQRWEYQIYKFLENTKRMLRVARPYFLGSIQCYEAIVLELLGPSLYDLWIRCQQRLSIRALAQIGYQLVCLMKYFHDHGLVYQNIRPEHFLYGVSGLNKWMWLYAVDLKYCKFWYETKDDKIGRVHIPYCQYKRPIRIGTHIRFMSINAHRGVEQTRRDDLESIGYLLVYLFRGDLPWVGLENLPDEQERHKKVADCKAKYISTLCQNMLPEFERYLNMVISLNFSEKPDYQTLIQLFQDVQQFIGYKSKYDLYDWDSFHQPKM